MPTAHSLQDLADVIQLIRINAIPQEYAAQLDPVVRENSMNSGNPLRSLKNLT